MIAMKASMETTPKGLKAKGTGISSIPMSHIRTPPALPNNDCFLLGQGRQDVLALAHPHGRWLEWL